MTPDGLITAGQRGEAFVMARFETHTVGSQFIVLPKGLEFTYPDEPEGNYIDKLVAAKLRKLRIAPSGLCDDETFLRRAAIDIVGLPPTPEEYARFMASTDPNKRARWVDELLERKEFSEIWVSKWAGAAPGAVQTPRGTSARRRCSSTTTGWSRSLPRTCRWTRWSRSCSASCRHVQERGDQLLPDHQHETPLTENCSAQVFMGIRVQCAQCHNHPFDRWTQDDYYSFAAFFAQIGRKQAEDYRETIIFNSGGGEVNHPVGGRAMPPKFLGGEIPDVRGKDRRIVLARWLASPQNPWFAASFANRVWAHFTGVGIVEPVDDFRVSNPESNPELLEALGQHFTATKYDLKALVRDICNSRTYQRRTQRNESNASDEKNFAHALVRRIKAESLLDTTVPQ